MGLDLTPSLRMDTKLIFFIVLIVGVVYGDRFFKDSDVVHILRKTNFHKRLTANSTASIVFFFAPYCEHSKKLAPVYSNVALSYQDVALFAAVDCSETINQALCRQFKITSFPTLKLFPPDADPPDNEAASTYSGTRSAQGISNSLKELVTDEYVLNLKHLGQLKEDKSQVVLFTEKKKPTLLYKSLAWRYHHRAHFYESNSKNASLLEHFAVTEFPTLLTMKDGKNTKYEGELNAPSLVRFFDELFGIHYNEEIDLHLRILSKSILDQVDIDEEIWLVGFFADPQGTGCSKSLQSFQESIVKVEEFSRIGIFNTSQDLGGLNFKNFGIDLSKLSSNPCSIDIVRFPFGVDKYEKDDYEVYPHSALDAKLLQEFVYKAITIKPTRLEEGNMAVFMNSELPKPKILLFASYEECPKMFASLAMALRHWKADFGFIPKSEIRVREQFQIPKIPSLTVVQFDPNAEENKQIFAPRYQGPLQFGPMKGWIEAILFTRKAQKEVHDDPFYQAENTDHLKEIKSEDDLEKNCNRAIPLCGFVVLDQTREKFQTQLDWLGTFTLQKANAPISFSWMDVENGKLFLQEFGVGVGDVPSLVVFSPKRLRYAVLKQDLDASQVEQFIDKVISGQQMTFPIDQLPPWSRQEEEEEVTEQEEDLEEIMAVELEEDIENKQKSKDEL